MPLCLMISHFRLLFFALTIGTQCFVKVPFNHKIQLIHVLNNIEFGRAKVLNHN